MSEVPLYLPRGGLIYPEAPPPRGSRLEPPEPPPSTPSATAAAAAREPPWRCRPSGVGGEEDAASPTPPGSRVGGGRAREEGVGAYGPGEVREEGEGRREPERVVGGGLRGGEGG